MSSASALLEYVQSFLGSPAVALPIALVQLPQDLQQFLEGFAVADLHGRSRGQQSLTDHLSQQRCRLRTQRCLFKLYPLPANVHGDVTGVSSRSRLFQNNWKISFPGCHRLDTVLFRDSIGMSCTL